MLNEENYWDTFRESTDYLMLDFAQKGVLEKDHSYEMSLLAITMLEFDRAKFYLEKFKDKFLQNWSGVKDFSGLQTKTEVISELLRQHELKEFLICTRHYNIEGMTNSPDLERFQNTLDSWLGHTSSGILENFNYLSDAYHSRCLFMDIMKNRHDTYEEEAYNKHHVRASLDYARGLLKMGHVDTAERVLSKAYTRKDRFLQGRSDLDFDVASLIVQSRLEGIDRDINFISRQMDESNINIKFLSSRFQKLDQLRENLSPKEDMDSLRDLKFSLLKLKTKTREISAIKDYIGPGNQEIEEQYQNLIMECLPLAARKIETVDKMEQFEKLVEGESNAAHLVEIKSKLYLTTCDVTENYLRWFKAKASEYNISLNQLDKSEPQSQISEKAKELVIYVAQLTRFGTVDHSKLLFVLEIVAEFGDTLGNLFIEEFEDTPTWIFIKWIPQIMSYLNFQENSFFMPLIKRLLHRYPEPMIYAISVAVDCPIPSDKECNNIKELRELLNQKIGEDGSHKKFIRSLECLLHPDQRLKEWIDLLQEHMMNPEMAKKAAKLIMKDIFSQSDPILDQGQGDFNKKFSKEMEKYVAANFGPGFSNLGKMTASEIEKASDALMLKADGFCKGRAISFNTSSYKTKLSAFAGWLSEYDVNNYRSMDQRLEVPGQYSGETEPVPELHVKIAYFLPEVMVIQSIRRPKRITMLGTDEKVYHCLVKGGEDLRLDQRVEQLFGIMNGVFARDAECAKREFRIGTFNVIPVKKHLGIMEWVKNTVPLKSVIEKEMPKNEDILNNKAAIKRATYLKQVAKGKDIREQHLALLSVSRDQVVKEFKEQCQYFKSTLLKTAIKKKVHNAEQFVKLRKQFLSNYAVLSLGSYILGVGDRHLDNFLFDYVNGLIVPIDFGYSFGFGVGLYIPELMPFRLTQNFMELLYPLGVQGVFRNSLIFAMKALKAERHIITDTCEVFIRDPLIDWERIAKSKTKKNSKASQVLEDPGMYPREKLSIVHKKLTGMSPVAVMLEELSLSRHDGQPYFGKLKAIVDGDYHRLRADLRKGILPLCEQIDVLIDMATDPDILGRTWSGWAPYA
jgi:DNA-dependent protein kinase catalytic subunit